MVRSARKHTIVLRMKDQRPKHTTRDRRYTNEDMMFWRAGQGSRCKRNQTQVPRGETEKFLSFSTATASSKYSISMQQHYTKRGSAYDPKKRCERVLTQGVRVLAYSAPWRYCCLLHPRQQWPKYLDRENLGTFYCLLRNFRREPLGTRCM